MYTCRPNMPRPSIFVIGGFRFEPHANETHLAFIVRHDHHLSPSITHRAVTGNDGVFPLLSSWPMACIT